jgi:hypothetical protein
MHCLRVYTVGRRPLPVSAGRRATIAVDVLSLPQQNSDHGRRGSVEPRRGQTRAARSYGSRSGRATWQSFKSAAGPTPISEVLGQLVSRHVQRHEARKAEAGTIDDGELLEALQWATDLQYDLGRLVERLEGRLDGGRSI